MLALDSQEARRLFEDIANQMPSDPSCEDALVPDVSIFYETLQQVAELSFSPEERIKEEHVRLIQSHLLRNGSPLELAPAAAVLSRIKLTAGQLQRLVDAYSLRLANISSGDRSFSFATSKLHLCEAVIKLAQVSKQKGIPPDVLLSALRTYLVRHLGGRRCADTMETERLWRNIQNTVADFNKGIRGLGASESLLIKVEETKPESAKGSPRVAAYWQGGAAQSFLGRIGRLTTRDSRKLTEEEKLDPNWQVEVSSLLNELEAWRSSDVGSALDYFHQKSSIYLTLLDLIPSGSLHETAVGSYLAFLSHNAVQRDSPIEWLWHLNRLLKLARPFTDEGRAKLEKTLKQGIQVPGLPHSAGPMILEELAKSRDPILSLYANLEKLVPQARGDWRQ